MTRLEKEHYKRIEREAKERGKYTESEVGTSLLCAAVTLPCIIAGLVVAVWIIKTVWYLV